MSDSANDRFTPLLPKLLGGDRGAEEEFFLLAHGFLTAVSRKFPHIPDANREDFVLEVIEKALSRLDRFTPSKASFSTWLYIIARNLAYDRGRKVRDGQDVLHFAVSLEALERSPEDPSGPEAVEEAPARPELAALRVALERLPANQVQILMEMSAGRTAREVGHELGLSPENVRKIYQRAKERLRIEILASIS